MKICFIQNNLSWYLDSNNINTKSSRLMLPIFTINVEIIHIYAVLFIDIYGFKNFRHYFKPYVVNTNK